MTQHIKTEGLGLAWHSLVPLIAAAILIIIAVTKADPWIAQQFFFDSASMTWLGANADWANDIAHRGGRNLMRGIGLMAIFAWIAAYRITAWRTYRLELGYVAACMAVVPLLVGALKLVTNVDCPWDMQPFGGARPLLDYYQLRPDTLPRGACFPGAHSSSAFALFGLAFLARRRSARLAYGLTVAIIFWGSLFSLAQQARGAHFLSHDLWSMALAWGVCAVLYQIILARLGQKWSWSALRTGGSAAVVIIGSALTMAYPLSAQAEDVAEDVAQAGQSRTVPSFSARRDSIKPDRAEGIPTDRELENSTAVIGKVIVRPLPIFDLTIPEENTRIFRLANRLHYGTRTATITDRLLIASGDPYDSKIIAESERLLRDTRYLYDAEIRPVSYENNTVDLEVLTRDVWTLNPGVSFGRKGGRNTTDFELEELNLLGWGTQLSLKHSSEVDRDSTSLRYVDAQLGSTWWRIESEYANNSDGRLGRLILEQPFYSLDTRWSAGFSLVNDNRIDNFYDRGEKVYQFDHRQRFAEIKWGWSAGRANRFVDRYTFGWTIDRNSFESLSTFSSLSQLLPTDRSLSYPWFQWERLEDNYLESRNLDQIERTEDVALGWRLATKVGFAHRSWSADRNAMIVDSTIAKGQSFGDGRQLRGQVAFSTRYENGRFQDTLFSSRLEYYRRQSERRLFFAALELDIGHQLDADRQLTLGGDSGLRGYPLRYRDGEGRWLLTLEQRAFSNWYPFRLVHVGGAAFVDVGSTWGASRFGQDSAVLGNVGVGLRLGNSRSALGNVLHIDLAMPFGATGSAKDLQLIIETKKSF